MEPGCGPAQPVALVRCRQWSRLSRMLASPSSPSPSLALRSTTSTCATQAVAMRWRHEHPCRTVTRATNRTEAACRSGAAFRLPDCTGCANVVSPTGLCRDDDHPADYLVVVIRPTVQVDRSYPGLQHDVRFLPGVHHAWCHRHDSAVLQRL